MKSGSINAARAGSNQPKENEENAKASKPASKNINERRKCIENGGEIERLEKSMAKKKYQS
jgi:hypothetical protein